MLNLYAKGVIERSAGLENELVRPRRETTERTLVALSGETVSHITTV